ncbi:3TM-type holin [Govanella unica]|uniref:Holin family protein n=1 Tax=Govanella unica TaxID=2975056 RepID=A0A9X3TZ73_9PROT|nr:3TM-type holin [Govania unica]MDA5194107.1 holin family protein [Govania unica]
MGILGRLIAGPAVDAVTAIGNVFDKLFTTDAERLQAEQVLQKIRQEPAMLQAEINKIEAAHRSVFVAGWRPFIGWVCGAGFAWAFIFQPILNWAVVVYGLSITPPDIVTDDMMELVIALLGLGAMRTFEKSKGRAR